MAQEEETVEQAHNHAAVSKDRPAKVARRSGSSALRHTIKGKKNPSCRTCTKRRIICDLGRPACKKCNKKGLECPGYGPRLRWAGGVAVRGKLKGQNVPIVDAVDEKSQSKREESGEAASEILDKGEQTMRLCKMPCVAEAAGIKAGEAPLIRPRNERERPEPGQNYNTAPTEALSPDFTLRQSARAFIEYYDRNIAGLMVWFDTADNDYRRRVLPLAANAPGLRLAVAAISAYHGGMTFDHEVPRFSETARDACLGLIRSRVADMTGRLTGGAALTTEADLADAEWMLAAILMISTYEMANAQAAAAESHRLAARTIVNVFGHHAAGGSRGSSRVFDFLRNQVSVLDVLSSTTSFDLADVEAAVLPPASMADDLFTQFLTELHRVTLISRRRDACVSGPSSGGGGGDVEGRSTDFATAKQILARFDEARRASLRAIERLDVPATVVGRDLIRLVAIYHYAGVLYSYRCLLDHAAPDHDALAHELFAQLAAVEDATLCAQSLPWPAFVAGTECYGDRGRQEAVAALLTLIAEATGFRHFLDVARFLRMFWAGDDPDWRPLARVLQQKGFRILAV